jgi:hypothetical protein
MPAPNPILHHLILGQIRCTTWALDFLWSLPNVAMVHLDPFEFIKPLSQATAKKMMARYLPAVYSPLIRIQISTQMLYCNPHFPLNLNKEKGFPGIGMAGPAI